MKIRKFQTGGYALASAAQAATEGTISLTELMAPYFSSAAAKLSSLATSAAPAATAVAIPVALTASGVYGTKANQKQVEKGMIPFVTSPHAALGYQQTYMSPKKETTVPSEPLVLRPEYRTVTTPVEALDIFGYKPIWAEGENSQNGSTVSGTQSGTGSGTGENIPNPEDENDKKIKELEEKIKQLENKPKKPKEYYDSEKDLSWSAPMSSAGKFLFKSRGPGEYTPFRTLLEYSLGLSTIGLGGYYGGKALGWWGEDSNNSSNEIDREGTEQAWKDMKVGRKPGQ